MPPPTAVRGSGSAAFALPLLPAAATPRRVDHIFQAPDGPIADLSHLMTALARVKAAQSASDSPCAGLLAAKDRAFCIVGAPPGVTGLYDVHLRPGTLLVHQATPIVPGLLRAGRPLPWLVVSEIARTWFELG